MSTTLLLAGTIFTLYDREEFKTSMKNELSILGNIIGDRSSAALLFNDKTMVLKNLSSLKAKPTIIYASIYNSDGTFIAHYERQSENQSENQSERQSTINKELSAAQQQSILKLNAELAQQSKEKIKQYKFTMQFLEIWEPIVQSGETIGLVYLKSDQSELDNRLNYFIKATLIIYFLSLFVALLMMLRLQKIITDPISNLVKTTNLISQEKDYSIRASSQSNDELGQLIDRFNEMLEQIESKDLVLKEVNSHLEQRVEERTQELTRSNAQLTKAKEFADIASKAKSEFLANMSHEIRTPMNGVLTTTELMLSEDMSDKSRYYLNIINTSAVSLLDIINDILDYSKVEAGKLIIENTPFHTYQIFDRLVDIFMSKLAEKNLELLFDIDPKTPIGLFGDAMRIQQVLINFIANSSKFTPENGTIICGVKVIKQDSEWVQLTFFVKDNGIGIKPSRVEALFNAFTQGDSTTTRKYGGTGLGLAICKSMIELMGGAIKVESKLGQGSCFCFDLELELAIHHATNIQQQNQQLSALSRDIKNINILVINGHEESRIITANIIQSFAFNAILASSGKEALDLLKNNSELDINLVLLDDNIANIDDFEISYLIRHKLNFKKPIILVVSAEIDKDLEVAYQSSINAFLQKPLCQSALFNTIVHLCNDDYHPANKPSIHTKEINYAKHLQGNGLLVVEDSSVNQQVILAIFDKVDISIKLVNNGKEAIEAIYKYNFDAILMDMQMPIMDGYEATRKIRAIPEFNSIPIIALTAHAMAGDEEKCLRAGSSAYVTKPINKEYLFKVLARFLHFKKIENNNQEEETGSDPSGRFSDSVNNDSALLDVIPGLNIHEAMKQINMNEVQFRKILLQFFSNNKDKVNVMSEYMKQGEWQLLKDMAHELKGSVAYLGAYNLQEKVLQLDLSCKKDFSNAEPLEKSFAEFSVALTQVLASIDTFVVSKTVASKKKQLANHETHGTHGTHVYKDKDKAEKIIIELNEALIEGKPIEVKNNFKLLKKQTIHPQLDELEKQINNFDFEEAAETLTFIKYSMGDA